MRHMRNAMALETKRRVIEIKEIVEFCTASAIISRAAAKTMIAEVKYSIL
ncbi:MAG TPA: hypothetical protein VKY57_06020 [Chitinispirillaceae bacterium]|nr:hypothetical protein [Chitinispirillaceae bacterium]